MVCICCGTAPIIPPVGKSSEDSYFKDSVHWCPKCEDFTEPVTQVEFERGYNLLEDTKRIILISLTKSPTVKEAAKLIGLTERTIYRALSKLADE